MEACWATFWRSRRGLSPICFTFWIVELSKISAYERGETVGCTRGRRWVHQGGISQQSFYSIYTAGVLFAMPKFVDWITELSGGIRRGGGLGR